MPEKEMVKFEIGIQDVDETKALVITEHVHQDEMSEVVPKDIQRCTLRAGAPARLPRPAALRLPVPGRRREAEREIGWPVPEDVPGRGRIELETLLRRARS